MKRNRLHSEWKEKPPKRDDTSGMDDIIASVKSAIAELEAMEAEKVFDLVMSQLDKRGTAYIP